MHVHDVLVGFFTNCAKMPILASEVLLCEKTSSDKILPPVGIELWPLITSDSKSNALLSEPVRHVLLRRSLNFCSCTTWFLDLANLARINRAWLGKEPKVSVLQANAKLVQKGECWTWNQKLWMAWVLSSLGVTFCHWIFLFSCGKASDANIGIFV